MVPPPTVLDTQWCQHTGTGAVVKAKEPATFYQLLGSGAQNPELGAVFLSLTPGVSSGAGPFPDLGLYLHPPSGPPFYLRHGMEQLPVQSIAVARLSPKPRLALPRGHPRKLQVPGCPPRPRRGD